MLIRVRAMDPVCKDFFHFYCASPEEGVAEGFIRWQKDARFPERKRFVIVSSEDVGERFFVNSGDFKREEG